jgi:hypothetical protein
MKSEDRLLRSQALYPVELWAQVFILFTLKIYAKFQNNEREF